MYTPHGIAIYFAFIAIEFNPLFSWNWWGSQFGSAGGGGEGAAGEVVNSEEEKEEDDEVEK